jgi:hypothetical protein
MTEIALTPEQQAQVAAAKRVDDIITAWRIMRCPKGLLGPDGFLHPNSSAALGAWLQLNTTEATFSVDTLDQALAATADKLHWFEKPAAPAAEPPKAPKAPVKQSMPLTKHDVRRQLEENAAKEREDRKAAEEWLEKQRVEHERANADKFPAMVYYDEKTNARFAGRPNHRAHQELVEAWAKRNPSAALARGIAVKA